MTYFGILGTLLQILIALWPHTTDHKILTIATLLLVSLAGGAISSVPRSAVTQQFTTPTFSITISQGDILEEKGNIIVGFTDTYDTDLDGGLVINPKSVQGQFQKKFYANNHDQLEGDLNSALSQVPPIAYESASEKLRGKLARYEIGTVAVLRQSDVVCYATAYGRMENSLRVSCSVDALWRSLTAVWESVRVHGSLDRVSIPIIGSELARVGSLDREALIKMIALSFASSSRESVVSRELKIIIHPKDREHVNMIEVGRFLRDL